MKRMKILGMGNALVDIMTLLKDDTFLKNFSFPKGSMQLVDIGTVNSLEKLSNNLNQKLTSGGSSANTIHGIAKLGVDTGYIGKIGNDPLGEFFKEDMIKSGIQPYLLYGKASTGRAVALVSPDSERTFATYLGAAIEISGEDLSPSIFTGFDFFHIEGYLVQNPKLIEQALIHAKNAGLKISIDMASYNVVEENIDFLKRIVNEYVDIIFANEDEARVFTGKNPDEALDIMACMSEIAVVKTGKNGSMIRREKEKYNIKAIKASVIDTTGAGDLYAAGFLYGLANNFSLKKSAKIGSILAGKVIEVIGAKIPDQEWDPIINHIKKIPVC